MEGVQLLKEKIAKPTRVYVALCLKAGDKINLTESIMCLACPAKNVHRLRIHNLAGTGSSSTLLSLMQLLKSYNHMVLVHSG